VQGGHEEIRRFTLVRQNIPHPELRDHRAQKGGNWKGKQAGSGNGKKTKRDNRGGRGGWVQQPSKKTRFGGIGVGAFWLGGKTGVEEANWDQEQKDNATLGTTKFAEKTRNRKKKKR